MARPLPDSDEGDEPRPSLIERLTALLTREPEDRNELLDLLRGAFERRLLDEDPLEEPDHQLARSGADEARDLGRRPRADAVRLQRTVDGLGNLAGGVDESAVEVDADDVVVQVSPLGRAAAQPPTTARCSPVRAPAASSARRACRSAPAPST